MITCRYVCSRHVMMWHNVLKAAHHHVATKLQMNCGAIHLLNCKSTKGLMNVNKLKIIRNPSISKSWVNVYSGTVPNVVNCSKEQESFVTIVVTVLLMN